MAEAGVVVNRTGLRRYTSMPTTPRRKKTLPEQPTKRHPIHKGPSLEIVQLVLRRAMRNGRVCCEVCGEDVYGERGLSWSVHHRKGRQGNRTDHSPANLLLVCGASNQDRDHGRIHSRRSESQPAGWWLSRIGDTDPLTVPVLIDGGSRWTYLTADGGYNDNPDGAICH